MSSPSTPSAPLRYVPFPAALLSLLLLLLLCCPTIIYSLLVLVLAAPLPASFFVPTSFHQTCFWRCTEESIADLVRVFSQVDATFQANSGHPGAPMGMAPVAHVVFNKFMTFNPKNPSWINRDRFVLSYVPFSGFSTHAMADAHCRR